jgi:RNA polymerase sigma factor (TIGR02999 family)
VKPNSELTRLLDSARGGDDTALQRIYEAVYTELHRLARGRLAEERAGHTLQPTALVHEAFLRLVGAESDWRDSAHFFGAAARAMRQILVDHVRRRRAVKRGAAQQRVTLSGLEDGTDADGTALERVLDVDAALTRLELAHPRKARVVELRFFAGLGVHEVATALGVSRQTVQLDWEFARAWLHRELARE